METPRGAQLQYSLVARRFPGLRRLSLDRTLQPHVSPRVDLSVSPLRSPKVDVLVAHRNERSSMWERLSTPRSVDRRAMSQPPSRVRPFTPASPSKARAAIQRPPTSVAASVPYNALYDALCEQRRVSKAHRVSTSDFVVSSPTAAKEDISIRYTLDSPSEREMERLRRETRWRAAVNLNNYRTQQRDALSVLREWRESSMSRLSPSS
eukprot:EC716607.1.p1 GENE.EC716607.1~~EC716607.1.p1  ORF type:complete len:208 (+),score=6.30 EC716607.1:111-734(+)